MTKNVRTQQLAHWCVRRLGPGELVPLVPTAGGQMSNVYRYLMEETSAVVKVRSESLERIQRCLSPALCRPPGRADGTPRTATREALDPPPPWMHWNPPGGGLWPPNGPIDRMDHTLVPDTVREWARRAASRLRHSALPRVLGHGDWETQNIRWEDGRPWSRLPKTNGRSPGLPACGRPSITHEESIYFARNRLRLRQ